MNISSKRRWRSSELIALEYLEKKGFKIVETRKKIKIEGVEVGEVDAIIESQNGERYAVEIKAGSVDVTGIRQAYVNAVLLGMKPLVVAKGFADDSALALARELGVEVLELGNQYLVEAEELEVIVESAIQGLLRRVLDIVLSNEPVPPQELAVIESMAKSRDIKEFADSLKTSVENAVKHIKRLQGRGLLPEDTKSYSELRMYAQLIVLRDKLSRLEKTVSKYLQ